MASNQAVSMSLDALLIRPDCYVAWAIGPDARDPVAGLTDALRTWCASAA
jgi:hypothetical protein